MKKILSIAVILAMIVSVFSGTWVMADSSGDVVTPYGTIPAEYADASAYPIVVFFSDKTFWHAGADWDSAIRKAVQICDFGSYGANILIRSDITVNSQYNSLEYMRNPLTIDLGGNAVTLAGGYLGQFANKFSLNVTAKDGSFILTDYALFDNFQYYDSDYTANLNFENLTFSYGAGATVENPVLGFVQHSSSVEVINETYTNCTFDFRENCPENAVLFKMGMGTIEKNISVNGCALLANDISKINIMQKNNNNSTIIFDKYNGEYITVSVPENSDVSELSTYVFPISSGNAAVAFDSNNDGYDTYKLDVTAAPDVPIDTTYGTIPTEYSNPYDYPIVVFFSDKTFWHAGDDWSTAMDKALVISGYGYGANILIRDDITISSRFDSLEYMTKPLTIDLGGNNVNLAGGYLGMFANKMSLDVFVKNGSFTITQYPVFKNFHYYSDNYTASLKFEDITFAYGIGATITEPVLGFEHSASSDEVINETYTNCTFDFRDNCPENAVVFKLGAGTIETNVVVNGCEILTDDISKIYIIEKNNEESSIEFAPYNDDYMTIAVPEGTAGTVFSSYDFTSSEGDLAVLFNANTDGYDIYILGVIEAPGVELTAPSDGEYVYADNDLNVKGSISAGYDFGSAKIYIDDVLIKTLANNTLTVNSVITANEISYLDYGKHEITIEAMYNGQKVSATKEFVYTAVYNKLISDPMAGKGAESSFASGMLYSFTNNSDYTFSNEDGSVSFTRSSASNGTDAKAYFAFAEYVLDSGKFVVKTKLTVSDPSTDILIDADNKDGKFVELDYILKDGKFFSSDKVCVADTAYDIEIIYDLGDNTRTYILDGEVIRNKIPCYDGNTIGQMRSYDIVWYGSEAAEGSKVTFDEFQLLHTMSMPLISNLEYNLNNETSVPQNDWENGYLDCDAQSVSVVMEKSLDKIPTVLLEKSGTEVLVSCSLSADNTKVIITPDEGFEPGFSYTITLSDVMFDGKSQDKNIVESFKTDSDFNAAFSVNGNKLSFANQINKGDVVSVMIDDITLPVGIEKATYVLSVRNGLKLVAMAGKTLSSTDDLETGFELTLPPMTEEGEFEVYLMVIDSYQGCMSASKYMSIR